MDVYEYRLSIEGDAEYHASALVRAAWRVAQRSHAGQMRKKDPDLPYLCHPIMVYDLLRTRGITDPRMLAAALLHDVGEMNPRYATDIRLLASDLQYEMVREGIALPASYADASAVAQWVQQMTNPVKGDRKESKLMVQMMRAEGMSHPAKIIKIADQTASLICHLMRENAASIVRDDSLLFARKADNLVHHIANKSMATPTQRAELQSWKKLFDRVYQSNKVLLNAVSVKARQGVRGGFRPQLVKIMKFIDRTAPGLLDTEMTYRRCILPKRLHDWEDVARFDNNFFGVPELGGICAVEYTQRGEVCAFTVWSAPEAPVSHPRNRMQQALEDFLQLHGHDLVVDTERQPVTLVATTTQPVEGRNYRLATPIPATVFTQLAHYADCIGHAEVQRVETQARNIERDFYLLETGGANR